MIFSVFSFLTSYIFAQDFDKQEKSLRRLSNAVLGIWWEGGNPTENEIMRRVAEADRSLLSHFAAYTIRVFIVSGEPVVMICTQDQQKAIFEDIACTAQIETRRYERNSPCEPQLDPIDYCRK